MFSKFVRNNITLVAIIIFVLLFILIIFTKPSIIFDKNGKPREFGVGYRNKTVCPIWLVIIICGIFSYLAVLYYINLKKFLF